MMQYQVVKRWNCALNMSLTCPELWWQRSLPRTTWIQIHSVIPGFHGALRHELYEKTHAEGPEKEIQVFWRRVMESDFETWFNPCRFVYGTGTVVLWSESNLIQYLSLTVGFRISFPNSVSHFWACGCWEKRWNCGRRLQRQRGRDATSDSGHGRRVARQQVRGERRGTHATWKATICESSKLRIHKHATLDAVSKAQQN